MGSSWREFLRRQRGGRPPPRVVTHEEIRARLQDELHTTAHPPPPVSFLRLTMEAYGEVLHRSGIVAAANLMDAAELLLLETTGPSAIVARTRAAEFAVLLPGTSSGRARAIVDQLQAHLSSAGVDSISVGMVTSLDHSLPLAQVLQRVDQALFEARGDASARIKQVVIEGGETVSYRPGDVVVAQRVDGQLDSHAPQPLPRRAADG